MMNNNQWVEKQDGTTAQVVMVSTQASTAMPHAEGQPCVLDGCNGKESFWVQEWKEWVEAINSDAVLSGTEEKRTSKLREGCRALASE